MFKNFNFYVLPQQKLYASTILGEVDGRRISVSQMLTAAENSLKFIKNHFNVDEKPYSVAIIVLNLMQMSLRNQNVGRPTEEQLKCLVDVVHEIEDLNAQTDIAKQQNEIIANDLKMIIEIYYRGDKND